MRFGKKLTGKKCILRYFVANKLGIKIKSFFLNDERNYFI